MFEIAFAFVVGLEGGYVDHPDDTGGPTKFGISQRQYPNLDIKGLTLSLAREIYRTDYWDKIHGDELPPAVGLIVFDIAVNSGTTRAIKELQKTLPIAVDGLYGPRTRQALQRCSWDMEVEGRQELAIELLLSRQAFYARQPDGPFKDGWNNRLVHLCYQAGICSM